MIATYRLRETKVTHVAKSKAIFRICKARLTCLEAWLFSSWNKSFIGYQLSPEIFISNLYICRDHLYFQMIQCLCHICLYFPYKNRFIHDRALKSMIEHQKMWRNQLLESVIILFMISFATFFPGRGPGDMLHYNCRKAKGTYSNDFANTLSQCFGAGSTPA